ncbi:MAG: FAD-dependent oxidoreductase, partial [Bacteroidota bacterium]|nr:FAD-dependent oxidoreductase [Bacteroidota bacterium]
MSEKKVVVIGSGFAGLSAATNLAAKGFQVQVLEKNATPGGRARSFNEEGFTFDMGPSWYWMPDVFEQYFQRFGKTPANYYDLVRLDPSYTVIFGPEDFMQVPAQMPEINALFESLEKGSSQALQKFMAQAAYKYQVGINQLVHKPS